MDIAADDLRWLAGLLEGEATFSGSSASKRNFAQVRVAMCDPDVVARAAALMGARRVNEYADRTGHGYRTVFVATVCGRPAAALMRSIRGLLGQDRRRQVDDVLAGYSGPVRVTRAVRAADATASPALAAIASVDGTGSDSLTWLAGLLEGEGWFALNGRYPLVGVEMCASDVVDRAHRLLGSRSVRRDASDLDKGWRPVYRTAIGGRRAAELMRTLRPLMGERRRAQIDRALATYGGPIRLSQAPETCTVPGCSRKHRSRGLCHTHYYGAAGEVAGRSRHRGAVL